MVVNVWLECIDSTNQFDCILAVGDSSSAIGWLFKSSGFNPTSGEHDAHLVVARKLATLLLDHDKCVASQHIKGELNVVADLLSFAGTNERGKAYPLAFDNPPNDILTHLFRHHLTSQVPENFQISQLPPEILCWVTLVLQTATSSLGAAKRDGTKDRTESGEDGKDSAGARGIETIPSSLCYPSSNGSFSPKRFCSATVPRVGPPPGTLQELVRSQWYRALCGKPQATWLRRFGVISGTAPCTARAAPTCIPLCAPSSKPTKTRTHRLNNNAR